MDFEALLADNKRIIERYVFFRISNKEDAEDILQETYLSAFQKYESLKDKTHFKSWIIRIAKNKCNDFYRKNRIDTVDEAGFDIPAGKAGIGEQFELLEIINSLNENDKKILSMYYFIGYSFAINQCAYFVSYIFIQTEHTADIKSQLYKFEWYFHIVLFAVLLNNFYIDILFIIAGAVIV